MSYKNDSQEWIRQWDAMSLSQQQEQVKLLAQAIRDYLNSPPLERRDQEQHQKDHDEYIEDMSYGGETYNPNETSGTFIYRGR
jgi:hypothetical protein